MLIFSLPDQDPPLINLGAPQVKIFLIPAGAVLSPDGTVIANAAPPAPPQLPPLAPQPAAPNTITITPPQEGELACAAVRCSRKDNGGVAGVWVSSFI